jgi:CYTH domain-containing protein
VPGLEIERKFLIPAPPADLGRHPASEIRQGYLAIGDDGFEVRVRRRDDDAMLTVKQGTGRTRLEEEIALAPDAFERLWPLTDGRRVEKVRHFIPAGADLTIELDVYGGDLDGLVTAEIEFPTEADAEAFEPPGWMGPEVTEDQRFKAQQLALDGAPAGVP